MFGFELKLKVGLDVLLPRRSCRAAPDGLDSYSLFIEEFTVDVHGTIIFLTCLLHEFIGLMC